MKNVKGQSQYKSDKIKETILYKLSYEKMQQEVQENDRNRIELDIVGLNI